MAPACTGKLSDANCWSTTGSGKAPAGGIPTNADDIHFDNGCTASCDLNSTAIATISVNSVTIALGYTGTISATDVAGVNPDFSTVAGYTQGAGTFSMNASQVSLGTAISLTAGTFNAGSGSLTVGTTTTVSGATAIFNSGSATTTFTGNVAVNTGGTFNAGTGMNTFSAALTIGNGARRRATSTRARRSSRSAETW